MGWTQVGKTVIREPLMLTVWWDQRRSLTLLREVMRGFLDWKGLRGLLFSPPLSPLLPAQVVDVMNTKGLLCSPAFWSDLASAGSQQEIS